MDCRCFLRHNYFVGTMAGGTLRLDRHMEYPPSPTDLRNIPPEMIPEVTAILEKEYTRRESMNAMIEKRRQTIANVYTRKHPDVYVWNPHRFLNPCYRESLHEALPGVLETKLFLAEFCDLLVEEIQHFMSRTDVERSQPNSMNRYGCLMDELDTEATLVTPLRSLLADIAHSHFGFPADCLTHHRCFIVKYLPGEDIRLSRHYDNSEITMNVCLMAKDVKGSLLNFFERADGNTFRSYRFSPGMAVFHLGSHHHEATTLLHGERLNLVLWGRSRGYRRQHGCPMCGSTTDLF